MYLIPVKTGVWGFIFFLLRDLIKLKEFLGVLLRGFSKKKIFGLKYTKNSDNVFTMTVIAEGGFPVKRFVVGNDVLPNISSLFDNPCVSQEFDFLDIMIKW